MKNKTTQFSVAMLFSIQTTTFGPRQKNGALQQKVELLKRLAFIPFILL